MVIRLFDMRLLGGEVTSRKFARFNSLRHDLISKNPDYEKYLMSKSKAVRMFVDVFIEYPDVVMGLAEKIKNNKDG